MSLDLDRPEGLIAARRDDVVRGGCIAAAHLPWHARVQHFLEHERARVRTRRRDRPSAPARARHRLRCTASTGALCALVRERLPQHAVGLIDQPQFGLFVARAKRDAVLREHHDAALDRETGLGGRLADGGACGPTVRGARSALARCRRSAGGSCLREHARTQAESGADDHSNVPRSTHASPRRHQACHRIPSLPAADRADREAPDGVRMPPLGSTLQRAHDMPAPQLVHVRRASRRRSLTACMDVSPILAGLNDAQRAAVTAPLAPTLVLAGAGSGKTRVLTHRVAWLVQVENVSPHGILAVTFTNKAAGEMRGRIEIMLGVPSAPLWVGTFHGIAHRLLRMHWREANLPQAFQIIDAEDQQRLIRKLLKAHEPRRGALGAEGDHVVHQRAQGRRACAPKHLKDDGDPTRRQFIKLYEAYQEQCDRNGVVDFAELLLRAYELWRDDPMCSRTIARASATC